MEIGPKCYATGAKGLQRRAVVQRGHYWWSSMRRGRLTEKLPRNLSENAMRDLARMTENPPSTSVPGFVRVFCWAMG